MKNNKGKLIEDKRARELIKILDKCDALLDLHASPNKKNKPFIICEKNDFPIANILDFEIISFGWDKIEPGATDGYMHKLGKMALCLECGSICESKKYAALAEKSIYRFLKFFDCIDKKVSFRKIKKRFIRAVKAVQKKSNNFKFSRKFRDFEKLMAGELIATDGKIQYFAKKNECIIFPHADCSIGSEAFIIGKETSK